MKIIMIASEVFPYAKAGGLGDVVPQLAIALANAGHGVKILMPLYKEIDRSTLRPLPTTLTVQLAGKTYKTALYYCELAGVQVYFLEYDPFFSRDGIYVDANNHDYPDNLLRFSFLSKSVFFFCRQFNWLPDIIHAHDWPSALAMTYLKEGKEEGFSHCAGVFSIHNIGYQGIFDYSGRATIDISPEDCPALGLEHYDNISLLKSALHCADHIVAVSPHYAQEILGEELGFGFHTLLRERKNQLSGILNGTDYTVWNPASDPLIPHPYDLANIEQKKLNKKAAQRRYGLEVSETSTLVGMVSRLVTQKGFNFLLGKNGNNLRQICRELDLQLLILGSGESWVEEGLRAIAAEQDNLSVIIGYDEGGSHLIQAASDFFLIPSLYEPCGLTQMYALRYGSIPIVSQTGGLIDTVSDIGKHPNSGTGIIIEKNLSSQTLFNALAQAVQLWAEDRQGYHRMQQRGMLQRFTWEKAAGEYQQVYQSCLD